MSDVNEQLGIAYSLRTFIEEETGINSIMYYNGIDLPDELPFVMVRSVLSPHTYLSKGRETVLTDFNFEISLYDVSLSELKRNQDLLRRIFFFEEFLYFNSEGERVKGVKFTTILRNDNHVSPEDITDKTRQHRVYFEITVEGAHHKY